MRRGQPCRAASTAASPPTEALAGIDLSKKQLRHDFYLTDDSLYRLREFLEEHLALPGTGRSFQQLIEEAVGKPVIGNVIQEPSQKPGSDDIFNQINGFRKAA